MRHTIRLLAVLGLCLSLSQAARADGVILNGVSARTIGRAGTNIGHSDSGSMLHDNPGAMSFMDGDQLVEFGAAVLATDFHYSDPDNSNTSSVNGYGLPSFSIVRRAADSCWTYGIGAFAPAGFGSSFTLNGPASFPGPQTYRSFGALIKLLPGVSYQATDNFSVGATLGGAFSIAELEGPYTLQSAPFTGLPTSMDLHADGIALAWSVGFMYKLSECTTLGLTYTSDTRFRAEGPTTVSALGGSSLYDTTVDITWPQSVGVGLRHELCSCRTVSADVIYYGWSNAFDDFGIHLSNPATPGFPPVVNETFPLNWRDTVSARLGFEQRLDDERTVRLGYVYHRSPIPSNTMTPWIPAALEHAFSVGYGLKYMGWDVDLAYMFTFGPYVDTTTSAFVGGDFDNSTNHDMTHCAAVSFIRRW